MGMSIPITYAPPSHYGGEVKICYYGMFTRGGEVRRKLLQGSALGHKRTLGGEQSDKLVYGAAAMCLAERGT